MGVDAVEQCGERGLNLIRPSPERHRQRGGFEVEGCRPTSTDRYSYRCPKPYPFLLPSAREKKRKKKKKISALSFSSSSLTPSSSPNSFSSSSLTPPQFLSSLTCAFESNRIRNGANGYEERNEKQRQKRFLDRYSYRCSKVRFLLEYTRNGAPRAKKPYTLFPLFLQSDAKLRHRSFGNTIRLGY